MKKLLFQFVATFTVLVLAFGVALWWLGQSPLREYSTAPGKQDLRGDPIEPFSLPDASGRITDVETESERLIVLLAGSCS